MESLEQFFIVLVRIVFIVFIPVVALYFRVIRKIQTGFAVGIILTSFLVGLLVSGSIMEDPVKVFARVINSGDAEESRTALKRVIQMGDTEFRRIDERKINDPELYRTLKNEILKEYTDIAERYYTKYSCFPAESCDNMEEFRTTLYNLGHAHRMWIFSEMLGGGDPVLRKKIVKALETGGEKLKKLSLKCAEEQ